MAAVQVNGKLSESRLMLLNGKLSKSGLLLVNDKAACQWQVKGMATCQRLLVQAASQWQAVQGKVTCPSRGCLSRVSCPRHGKLSKAWQVVQGMASCPRHGKLSKAWQVVQGMASCPRHGKLSKAWQVVQENKTRDYSSLTTASCLLAAAHDSAGSPCRSFESTSTSGRATSSLTTPSCPPAAALNSAVRPCWSFELTSTSGRATSSLVTASCPPTIAHDSGVRPSLSFESTSTFLVANRTFTRPISPRPFQWLRKPLSFRLVKLSCFKKVKIKAVKYIAQQISDVTA